MEDLASKTDCPIVARLEAVILTETLVPNVFNVRDYFNIDSLVMLLETTTMLVPFRNNDQGLGLQHVLRPVAEPLAHTAQHAPVPQREGGLRVQLDSLPNRASTRGALLWEDLLSSIQALFGEPRDQHNRQKQHLKGARLPGPGSRWERQCRAVSAPTFHVAK